MNKKNKDCLITIRVKKEDKDKLIKRASESGKKLSDLIRFLLGIE